MSTRKTSVVIDERLLDEVRGILDTTTIRETIESALREVVRQRARQEEIEALASLRGLELDDSAVMIGAWRE